MLMYVVQLFGWMFVFFTMVILTKENENLLKLCKEMIENNERAIKLSIECLETQREIKNKFDSIVKQFESEN